MRNYSRITPEGTKDILFEECRARRETERRLASVFSRRGYHEVLTPGIEFYDLFRLPGAAIPQEDMYKTTDNNGRLVVLRPDSTLPIARMAAARLPGREGPLRLFYNQTVYRNCPDLSGHSTELPQMGVELLGADGLRADLEIVSLAVQALASCCGQFRLEIGHARIFSRLADRLPISEEEKEQIRDRIESKNYAALDVLLSGFEPCREVEALKRLPSLFGGEEALRSAEEFCDDEQTAAMLGEVRRLYTALADFGLGDRIIVDLGLVHRVDYYTGPVFSAYVEESGDAVLSGGRYDALLAKFGRPMPAMGFCIDTSVLAQILLKHRDFPQEPQEILIVHSEPGYEIEGQKTVDFHNRQGHICESSVYETLKETLAYARRVHAAKVLVTGPNPSEISLREEQA